MSIVYKTTNLVNNKIYVGKHHTSVEDGYLGSGIRLKRAIRKYGKHNFDRTTLETCDVSAADVREQFWITELSATDDNVGYNLTMYGGGNPGGNEKFVPW